MSKRLSLFLFLFFCLPWLGHAQTKEKGFFVEFNAGHAHTDFLDNDGKYVNLSPRIGYRFNTDWAVGLKFNGEAKNDFAYRTYGGYAQYTFFRKSVFNIFAEGEVTYSKDTDADIFGLYGTDYVEAGISFGASCALNRHFSLLVRYLYIGYSDSRRVHEGACLGDHKFIVDANMTRLMFGVQYIF